MNKIRTLIVDDSAFNRTAVTRMLSSDPGIDVVGSAIDGVDAIAKTTRLRPDVITLDLEMPNMDGFTFLRWLMAECPTPVIVLSARSDSRSVFRALELGAVEFLAKPETQISRSIESVADDLRFKIHAVMNLEMSKVKNAVDLIARKQPEIEIRKETGVRRMGRFEVIAVASSTGGPPALQAILTNLPAEFNAAILISQHMPAGFTRSFAERLNKICALTIREATHGERVEPGTVLIAPGGYHLTVCRDSAVLTTALVEKSNGDLYVPSADRMMCSIAQACGAATLGVVLTGMGRDGSDGAVAIKQRGGECLAESDESAVIFGMPQEAIRTGAVDKVLPLGRMAEEIIRRCSSC